MRVIVIGPPRTRAGLRAELEGAGIEIAGEAPTMDAARALDREVDAFIMAPDLPPAPGDHRVDEDVSGLVESLTPREHDVLALLALGLSNKTIAERLAISDQTVKFHVASIYGKLGASNRTDAVRRAFRRGIISL